jgi:hypothetical protein
MQGKSNYDEVAEGLPRAKPRQLGVAMVQLPVLYLKTLFTPSTRWFAEEGQQASWGIVWVQVILLIIVPGILGYFRALDRSAAARDATNSQALGDLLSALIVSTSIIGIVVQTLIVPAFFFFGVIIQFILAKAFRGYGSFLAQSHTMLLYHVPLTIINSALSSIFLAIHLSLPLRLVLNPVVDLVLFIYGLFLNIAAITGVHRLTRGRATLVVVLAYIIFWLIIIVLLIMLARAIVSALHTT